MDNIYFKESLKLVIYTVGYSKEGESLLILIKADDVIRYSIVIDGYKVEDNNITCQLLEAEKMQQIDMFCWSHPDRDHSVGIEDYIPFMDRNTQIILGDGFEETLSRWKDSNAAMYEFIGSEFEKPLTRKDRIKIRTVCTGMNCKKIKFTDTRTGIEYPFELNAFAPDSYLNTRREFLEMRLLNNEISVGLDIKLGDLLAVFCTNDLEKEEQDEMGGVIKTSFWIDNKREVSNFTFGNAKEVV